MLTFLASSIVIFICFITFGVPPEAFLLLVPISIGTFALSLIIGYFLSEPLRLLIKRAAAFRSGADVVFEPDGRLYEADELSSGFQMLAQTSKKQQRDLILKERRQTQFIGDVAHELRTPLTAIHGNAELLLDPDLPTELHGRFCSTIIGESERLGNLTNDLLTLQHIEDDTIPAELFRVNLNDMARDAIETLDPILREHKANVALVGEAPDVLGNPERLKQVMLNLVENASRFIDLEGHITIELFGLKGNSILAVKDDGCGFGDDDPKLLFDRFYRTDLSRSRGTGGTGLGLAIVKSIVEAHDGTVEAFNLPDGGACFIVALPSIPADTAA